MAEESMRKRLIVATNNGHKLHEIQSILGANWIVSGAQSAAPGVIWEENGGTFLDNARIKVAALRPYTDAWILADDSGLCVDVLGGRPGVYSSCYGGIEGDHQRNVQRLLEELKGVAPAKRSAYFYCLILLARNAQHEECFEGRCFGSIAESPSGLGGFGYDPVFVPEGGSKTMAQMTDHEKNKISHRGQALSALVSAMMKNGL